MDKSTNQIIAEFLGKCWHADFTERFYCTRCPPWPRGSVGGTGWQPDPDYTSSLDAVSVAEKKAVEVWGEEKWHRTLTLIVCPANLYFQPNYAEVARAEPAPRSQAVRKLIEESK